MERKVKKNKPEDFKPPAPAKFLLGLFLNYNHPETMIGDFDEEFNFLVKEKGKFRAGLWYYLQIFITIPSFVNNMGFWSIVMFKNYLKISFRNFRKQKVHSIVNISGLAVGMACCILMLLWVQDEWSFDRFHENADDIYRIIIENRRGNDLTLLTESPLPLGPALKAEYPEVTEFCRYTGGYSGWNLKYGDKSYNDDNIAFADPGYFTMFSFPFIKGDPETALKDRYSVVLNERLAGVVFGNEDPIGKIMQMSGRDLKVTGVIKNIPENSHMLFDYIIPIINLTVWTEQDFESWQQSAVTYIQLQKNSRGMDIEEKISGVVKKYHPESDKTVTLQPLKKIHLYSDFSWDGENIKKGSIKIVYIFTLTAIIILLIACINFMNLSTARSGSRAKEVGVRKVSGAYRKDIIKQFFGESILLSFIALVLAVALTILWLPVFNGLSGKNLELNLTGNILLPLILISVTMLTGLLSGTYPALYLSSFSPVNVLKRHSISTKNTGSFLRKILVVFQFTFTVILLICVLVISKQLNYIDSKPLGYDKENIVYFPGYGKYWNNFDSIRSEMIQHPDIVNMTKGFPPRGPGNGMTDFSWEGKDPETKIVVHPSGIKFDYIETFNMEIVEGRSFSREYATDTLNCIINETAVRVMGLQDPVGKRIWYSGDQGYLYRFTNEVGKIIGVVKDFHIGSLHQNIPPMILKYSYQGFYVIARIKSENISGTLAYLETKWKEYVPGRPFKYSFLDEDIEGLYKSERKVMTIFRYFTFLAIFISCLGLFGLSLFMAEQRTKEIGIRKTLGASVPGIMLLLTGEFAKWVILSNVIAWPAAYFIMSKWLQDFAYRINIGLNTFILAGLLALLIALATISYQAAKAARANPVSSLKYE